MRRRDQQGFVLLEVVLAMGLMMLIMGSVAMAIQGLMAVERSSSCGQQRRQIDDAGLAAQRTADADTWRDFVSIDDAYPDGTRWFVVTDAGPDTVTLTPRPEAPDGC